MNPFVLLAKQFSLGPARVSTPIASLFAAAYELTIDFESGLYPNSALLVLELVVNSRQRSSKSQIAQQDSVCAFHILHVEDDPDDARIVSLGLERAVPGCLIQRVTNGQQAIQYLSGQAEYAACNRYPFPDLVLLDLRMPIMSGFELLAWLGLRGLLQSLMVVVLTGSPLPPDFNRAGELGLRYYFVKTPLCQEVIEFISKFANHSQLPPPNMPGSGASGERPFLT